MSKDGVSSTAENFDGKLRTNNTGAGTSMKLGQALQENGSWQWVCGVESERFAEAILEFGNSDSKQKLDTCSGWYKSGTYANEVCEQYYKDIKAAGKEDDQK